MTSWPRGLSANLMCTPRAFCAHTVCTSACAPCAPHVHCVCASRLYCVQLAHISCAPRVLLMCTLCALCVHLMHTSRAPSVPACATPLCALYAPYVHLACIFCACAPRAPPVHLVCALRAPCAHLVYTLCAPRAHLCTPRVPVGALRAHLLCISCAPCMKLACTPRRAPSVPACATPCVHRGHLKGILWAPFVHHVCTPCAPR